MSFEVTYKDLLSPAFAAAVKKIVDFPGIKDAKTLVNVTRIYKGIMGEVETATQTRTKLITPYLDETKQKVAADYMGEWTEKQNEFLETSFTINARKLSVKEIMPIGLAASEIASIDCLLVDAVEESQNN